MKCSCCGKHRLLLESFEKINGNLDLCSRCSDLIYLLRDSNKSGRKKDYDYALKELTNRNKHDKNFDDWFEKFKKDFEN